MAVQRAKGAIQLSNAGPTAGRAKGALQWIAEAAGTTIDLTTAAFSYVAQSLGWSSDYNLGLANAGTVNVTPNALDVKKNFSVALDSVGVTVTPQAIDWIITSALQLTAAGVNITPQDINYMVNTVIALDQATLKITRYRLLIPSVLNRVLYRNLTLALNQALSRDLYVTDPSE